MKHAWIKPAFLVASLYDLFLGVTFLFWFKPIYAHLGITLPNHDGYVQFPAALVAIFGYSFWLIAMAPERNREMIKLGILLKVAYAAIALGHAYFGAIPSIWIPFAWADLAFLVVFVAALRAVPRTP